MLNAKYLGLNINFVRSLNTCMFFFFTTILNGYFHVLLNAVNLIISKKPFTRAVITRNLITDLPWGPLYASLGLIVYVRL